jgi:hypothetical protein
VWFQLQLLRAVRVDADEGDGVSGVADMQQWDVCYEREVCLFCTGFPGVIGTKISCVLAVGRVLYEREVLFHGNKNKKIKYKDAEATRSRCLLYWHKISALLALLVQVRFKSGRRDTTDAYAYAFECNLAGDDVGGCHAPGMQCLSIYLSIHLCTPYQERYIYIYIYNVCM